MSESVKSSKPVIKYGHELRKWRPVWAAVAVGVISLSLDASGVIGELGEGSAANFDHIVAGQTIRGGTTVNYEAGIMTKCFTRGNQPVVVDVTADLVTDIPGSQQSARGRIVKAVLKPGSHDCKVAVSKVFTDQTTAGSVTGSIKGNVGGLSTEIFGDGDFPTGSKFQNEISDAEHEGIPVIHYNF